MARALGSLEFDTSMEVFDVTHITFSTKIALPFNLIATDPSPGMSCCDSLLMEGVPTNQAVS
jgi:hypothetical protein